MQRKGSNTAKISQSRNKNTVKNKQNPLSDAIYLIQNQNEVLRMKNTQLNEKIRQLKAQLQLCTDNIVVKQSEISIIKNNIEGTTYKEDIEIQNQKKLVIQKLAIAKSNEEMLLRKIQQAREASIFQQQKLQSITHDKKMLEVDVLSLRAQNQGTKIILRNLQEQNERLRQQNQKLVSKRKIFQPKQRQLALQIQQRIRLIKNQKHNLKILRINQTSKLIQKILTIIFKNKMKEHLSRIDRYGLNRKIAKKKVIQLSLIRRRYLNFIKNNVLQIFRQSFKPLQQYQTARRIINDSHKRRIKFIIWRKWRKASVQSVYTKTRRFQTYNLLTKLQESFSKTLLYSAFNQIRYFRNKAHRQRGAIQIQYVFTSFMNRSKTFFMSNLKQAQQKHEMDMQIDASSKQQSQLLLTSLYFSAWAKKTLTSRIQNKNIKRRYFKQLKKLIAIKNKRILGQMLMNANIKINNIDLQAKVLNQIKKQSKLNLIQNNIQEHNTIIAKNQSLKQQNQALQQQKKALYQQLALIRITKYLKKKTQKAFDVWRLRKQQAKRLMTIINLIQNKKSFDKNFAFSKILKKRFAMLKKSIRDKIQSCQFSYNYLLDQNKHIKEVLDKKQHELQKTKFVKLLQGIIKNQKQAKFKYFYKYLRNGYKYWKFRKTVQRIDFIASKKIKMVFMWIMKQDYRFIKNQQHIQSIILQKQKKITLRLFRKSFNGFKECLKRNKRIRGVLRGVFQRNLELDFYQAFGKIRNQQHLYNRSLIQQEIDEVQGQIDKTNALKAQQQNKNQILVERLKDKQQTLRQRKILGLYRFYVKYIKLKYGSFIQRWHKRVKRQNNVVEFAQILERKSSVLLKTKFLLTMNRKNQQYTINQYQNKLNKFKQEYDQAVTGQQKFLKDSEIQSKRMKQENQFNKKEGEFYEKKTNHMNNIQLKSYTKAANKRLLGYCFRQWSKQKQVFKEVWGKINRYYQLKQIKSCYPTLIKQMSLTVNQFNLRRKLQKIYYNQRYFYNISIGFNIWRFTNLNKTNLLTLQEEARMKKRFQGLQKKYNGAILKYNNQFKFRVYDGKTRSVFNEWRIYSQKRIKCKRDDKKLTQITWKSYCGQFFKLLKKKVSKGVQLKHNIIAFQQKWKNIRLMAFMNYTLKSRRLSKSFQKIFIQKYCPYLVHTTQEQFFSRVKNFINTKNVNQKTKLTGKIQKVIQTFEKKRKDILNLYLRKWRRNQYLMNIQFNLMRRITRNAMNWRVKDIFFAWKLQKQAKHVKQMHQQEGQVKKRKIQINRLKIFLQDFKKEKGLLLQNQGGQLVVSPRFQQKKQQQIKKDNNLRYKFISRVILSMNGYSSAVKSYNNMRLYMLLREKYKKLALVVKNKLRKPDLYFGFKIWQAANKRFNDMFQTIQRKQLIKILNKQKDKMQMEYSKKVSLIQKINQEMNVHKLLSHQEQKKQKLCVHVFLKNLRKIKTYALLTWKTRVQQMKQAQLGELQQSGNQKINTLEDQVRQLEEMQLQMRQNNQKLEMAVQQALQIAQMVRKITQQRDIISNVIKEKEVTCQSLQQQNQQLNAKLYLAQKEAMNLLILSGEKL